MFFDILEMTTSYIQYLYLLIRIAPGDFPDFFHAPIDVVRYFVFDVFLGKLHNGTAVADLNNSYTLPGGLRLPYWLPLDMRLECMAILILGPLLISILGMLIVSSKLSFVMFLCVLVTLFAAVFGAALLHGFYHSLAYDVIPHATRVLLLSIGLPLFCFVLVVLCWVAWRARRAQYRRRRQFLQRVVDEERRGRERYAKLESLIDRENLSVEALAMHRARAQRRQHKIAHRRTSDVVMQGFVVLGILFAILILCDALHIASIRSFQRTLLSHVLGYCLCVALVLAAVWLALGLFRTGRRLQYAISDFLGSIFLMLVIFALSFLYTTMVTYFVHSVYCHVVRCGPEARLYPSGSVFPRTTPHAADQGGGVCIALRPDSFFLFSASSVSALQSASSLSSSALLLSASSSQMCSASWQQTLVQRVEAQSRLVYDETVPCEMMGGYFRAGTALIFATYLVFLPALQIFLVHYIMRVLQRDFPLEQRVKDAMSERECYYCRIELSCNPAISYLRAYKPEFRYYSMTYLLEKIVLAVVSCVMQQGAGKQRAWVGFMLFALVCALAATGAIYFRPFMRPSESIYYPVLQICVAMVSIYGLMGYGIGPNRRAMYVLGILVATAVFVVPVTTLIVSTIRTLRWERRMYLKVHQRLDAHFSARLLEEHMGNNNNYQDYNGPGANIYGEAPPPSSPSSPSGNGEEREAKSSASTSASPTRKPNNTNTNNMETCRSFTSSSPTFSSYAQYASWPGGTYVSRSQWMLRHAGRRLVSWAKQVLSVLLVVHDLFPAHSFHQPPSQRRPRRLSSGTSITDTHDNGDEESDEETDEEEEEEESGETSDAASRYRVDAAAEAGAMSEVALPTRTTCTTRTKSKEEDEVTRTSAEAGVVVVIPREQHEAADAVVECVEEDEREGCTFYAECGRKEDSVGRAARRASTPEQRFLSSQRRIGLTRPRKRSDESGEGRAMKEKVNKRKKREGRKPSNSVAFDTAHLDLVELILSDSSEEERPMTKASRTRGQGQAQAQQQQQQQQIQIQAQQTQPPRRRSLLPRRAWGSLSCSGPHTAGEVAVIAQGNSSDTEGAVPDSILLTSSRRASPLSHHTAPNGDPMGPGNEAASSPRSDMYFSPSSSASASAASPRGSEGQRPATRRRPTDTTTIALTHVPARRASCRGLDQVKPNAEYCTQGFVFVPRAYFAHQSCYYYHTLFAQLSQSHWQRSQGRRRQALPVRALSATAASEPNVRGSRASVHQHYSRERCAQRMSAEEMRSQRGSVPSPCQTEQRISVDSTSYRGGVQDNSRGKGAAHRQRHPKKELIQPAHTDKRKNITKEDESIEATISAGSNDATITTHKHPNPFAAPTAETTAPPPAVETESEAERNENEEDNASNSSSSSSTTSTTTTSSTSTSSSNSNSSSSSSEFLSYEEPSTSYVFPVDQRHRISATSATDTTTNNTRTAAELTGVLLHKSYARCVYLYKHCSRALRQAWEVVKHAVVIAGLWVYTRVLRRVMRYFVRSPDALHWSKQDTVLTFAEVYTRRQHLALLRQGSTNDTNHTNMASALNEQHHHRQQQQQCGEEGSEYEVVCEAGARTARTRPALYRPLWRTGTTATMQRSSLRMGHQTPWVLYRSCMNKEREALKKAQRQAAVQMQQQSQQQRRGRGAAVRGQSGAAAAAAAAVSDMSLPLAELREMLRQHYYNTVLEQQQQQQQAAAEESNPMQVPYSVSNEEDRAASPLTMSTCETTNTNSTNTPAPHTARRLMMLPHAIEAECEMDVAKELQDRAKEQLALMTQWWEKRNYVVPVSSAAKTLERNARAMKWRGVQPGSRGEPQRQRRTEGEREAMGPQPTERRRSNAPALLLRQASLTTANGGGGGTRNDQEQQQQFMLPNAHAVSALASFYPTRLAEAMAQQAPLRRPTMDTALPPLTPAPSASTTFSPLTRSPTTRSPTTRTAAGGGGGGSGAASLTFAVRVPPSLDIIKLATPAAKEDEEEDHVVLAAGDGTAPHPVSPSKTVIVGGGGGAAAKSRRAAERTTSGGGTGRNAASAPVSPALSTSSRRPRATSPASMTGSKASSVAQGHLREHALAELMQEITLHRQHTTFEDSGETSTSPTTGGEAGHKTSLTGSLVAAHLNSYTNMSDESEEGQLGSTTRSSRSTYSTRSTYSHAHHHPPHHHSTGMNALSSTTGRLRDKLRDFCFTNPLQDHHHHSRHHSTHSKSRHHTRENRAGHAHHEDDTSVMSTTSVATTNSSTSNATANTPPSPSSSSAAASSSSVCASEEAASQQAAQLSSIVSIMSSSGVEYRAGHTGKHSQSKAHAVAHREANGCVESEQPQQQPACGLVFAEDDGCISSEACSEDEVEDSVHYYYHHNHDESNNEGSREGQSVGGQRRQLAVHRAAGQTQPQSADTTSMCNNESKGSSSSNSSSSNSEEEEDHTMEKLRYHYLLQERLTESYWENKARLLAVQQSVDTKMRHFVRATLQLFLVVLGCIACAALALAVSGLNKYIDGAHFMGGHRQRSPTLEHELAGYASWEAFTASCCCVATVNLSPPAVPYYALDAEDWLCANGYTKERIRRDRLADDGKGNADDELASVVYDGYAVRPLCGMEFSPGCTLDVNANSKVSVKCSNPAITEEQLKRW